MSLRKLIIFIPLLLLCKPVFADVTYFSCQTTKGYAVIKESGDEIIYSMNPGGVAFKSKGEVHPGFNYNHYSRFQTDYFYVSFLNHDYKYTIFSNNEGDDSSQGVTVVNLNKNKEYTYSCKKTDIDRLSELSGKMECDKNSALGC